MCFFTLWLRCALVNNCPQAEQVSSGQSTVASSTRLLGGVSALVLALGLTSGALAENQANDNTGIRAISHDGDDDWVAAFKDAVVEGVMAGTGNAPGENANNNAVASYSSAATRSDASGADAVATNGSTAVDDREVEGGFVFGRGNDATLAFGRNNVVAGAHLNSAVSGLVLIANSDGNILNAHDHGTVIGTGHLLDSSLSSATGASRVVHNTGIANQGRTLAVAGTANFGKQ